MSLVSDGASLFATPFINVNTSINALTLFGWAKYASTSGAFNLIGLHNTAGNGGASLFKFGTANNNGGGLTDDASHFLFSVESGFTAQTNVWEPLCVVISNNSNVSFLSPRASSSNTTASGTVGTATWNQIQVLGQQTASGSPNAFLPTGSMLAEVAIWQVALSLAEQRELVFGQVSPYRVRPSQLLCYLPLRDAIQDFGPLHLPFAPTAGGSGVSFSGDHPIQGGPRMPQQLWMFKLGSSVQHAQTLSAANGTAIGLSRAISARRGVISPQSIARTMASSRSFGASDSNVAAMSYGRARFVGPTASNAQSAALTRQNSHPVLSAVASPSVPSLASLFRVFPSVVAASHAQATLLLKITGKAFGVGANESAALNRAYGQSYGASNAQTAATARSSKVPLAVASVESVALVRTMPRRFAVASGQVVRRGLTVGKVLTVQAAQALRINRAFPFHLAVASPESTAMTTTGGRSYFRVFSIASAQALSVARGMVVKRGAASAESTGLIRIPGKHLSASDTQSASIVRSSNRAYAAANASSAAIVRRISTLKQVASGSVPAVLPAAIHRLTVLSSFLLQAAAKVAAPVRWKSLSASDSSSAGMSFHATRKLPETLSAASAQSGGVVKNTGKLIGVVAVMTISVRRSLGAVLFSVSTAQVATALKTVGKAFTAASPESPAVTAKRVRPSINSVASSQATFLRASSQRLFGVASAQAANARRAISKIMPFLAAPQHAGLGKGGAHSLSASMPQSATVATPHGMVLGAVTLQVPAVISWYHLYVPQWAWQQATFLPPSGGPAEPPSFGPIDPTDQTTFSFDWSRRIAPTDSIVSASVVSVPPGMILASPVFIQGYLVQATLAPFAALQLPTVFSLRCSVVTASGRRSSFSIPVPVRML